MRVTATTTPSELAKEINGRSGFRATVWGRDELRRVYIRRFPYPSRDENIYEGLATEFTVYVEFRGGDIPLLTVKEADMVTKNPQWECMMVSRALSRSGVHVECRPTPLSTPSHSIFPDDAQSFSSGGIPCDCIGEVSL